MSRQYARVHRAAYFQWQFFDSFYPTICMTAWNDTRLIGMFGLQQRSLADGTLVGHCIDLLLDPAYRGQGIFGELGRHAAAHFQNLAALTVFPNANGRRACEKSLGMRPVAKIDDMVLKALTAGPAQRRRVVAKSRKAHVSFSTGDAYRAWRYDRSPQYSYKTIGKGITKTFLEPATLEHFGDIVDWTEDASADEIRYTSEQLLSHGHEEVSTWALPHTEQYSDLRSLGFVQSPRERYFCVKVLSGQHQYLYDVASWRVVPGDAEIY